MIHFELIWGGDMLLFLFYLHFIYLFIYFPRSEINESYDNLCLTF